MTERSDHKAVTQQGDEYVCSACGKRWDRQDEREGDIPKCTPISRLVGERRVYGGAITGRWHNAKAG